jgi:hypothetical protein
MEPRVTEPQIVTRNVQPSVATRLADVTHRLATSSYSTSRTLANSATSASHMALSQSDVVQESLEAVLHKMQEATRALVIYFSVREYFSYFGKQLALVRSE